MLMPERQYKTDRPAHFNGLERRSVASEINSERELHVSRSVYRRGHQPEVGIVRRLIPRGKDMPVECIQQLRFQLERNRFAKPEIPNDAEIFILVAPGSGICVVSRKVAQPERLIAGSPGVRIRKGCPIKLTITEGIKTTTRRRGREDILTGHSVETNTLIPAWYPRSAAKCSGHAALIPLNPSNLPTAEYSSRNTGLDEWLAFSKRKFVQPRRYEHQRHVLAADRPVQRQVLWILNLCN